ncbi:transcription factor ORG2-like [Senna tora]|uniref:Transcription factor ORG2-like n=1 Tax=Senna tora TaxID=362788 RepID=A0A834TDL2_9FABA|nr:transcription factor ORG2-like [Senna tora]
MGWSLLVEETETCDEYSLPHQVETCTSSPSSVANKFNHNASERHRRKKINTLYSSLRSLLPLSHRQMKKVSIPATISMVVKYIPELEQEVEGLVKKKEQLLLTNSVSPNHNYKQRSQSNSANCVVSTTKLNNCEGLLQISSYYNIIPLSHILHSLEQLHPNSLSFLNASSFHTFQGTVFHHLHFQVGKCWRLEWDEIITAKLLSIYENKEQVFSSNIHYLKQ